MAAPGSAPPHKPENLILRRIDALVNWFRAYSFWPMFFGLSCCFIEESTALTPRYDLARFGAEVLRGSPRQADLLIISGTVFKKIAPVVLRLYEQMAEPKWVISMGSCANSGGMYDCYSVVQGVDQICRWISIFPAARPGPRRCCRAWCCSRKKCGKNARPGKFFTWPAAPRGPRGPWRWTASANPGTPRGPGYYGTPLRGTAVTPPFFWESRAEVMWTPPPARIELSETDRSLAQELQEKFGDAVQPVAATSDMLTFQVTEEWNKEVLRFLKQEASPRFRRLEDLTAVDESTRRERAGYPDYTLVYHLLAFEPPTRVRLKVPLYGTDPVTRSVTDIWPSANWYERECFDMFGIRFDGHPRLWRLLMPHDWDGHPLRKSYPDRGTASAALYPGVRP